MCGAKPPSGVDKTSWVNATLSIAHSGIKTHWLNLFETDARSKRQSFFEDYRAELEEEKLVKAQFKLAWEDVISRDQYFDQEEYEPIFDKEYSIYLATLATNYSSRPAFEREGDGLAEIPDRKLESIPAEILTDIRDEAEYTSVKIEGPLLIQQRLRELVRENKEVFRANLQGQPAHLIPFNLEVNESEWFTKKNQTASSHEKARNMEKIIRILHEHDIIEPSVDSHYSHAFLVPKPNGKWRLVLEFKNLNAATNNQYQWPIPDIKEMLHRVGESRPHFFAVFDLTSGYYQAPISEESRKYTAFRARNGIYRWKRLPMGLTGAGSYFQHSLVTQDLMRNGVELYLDDCMVHADSIESVIDRLRFSTDSAMLV